MLKSYFVLATDIDSLDNRLEELLARNNYYHKDLKELAEILTFWLKNDDEQQGNYYWSYSIIVDK